MEQSGSLAVFPERNCTILQKCDHTGVLYRTTQKDNLKTNLKSCNIDVNSWEEIANDRTVWRNQCSLGTRTFEANRAAVIKEKKERREQHFSSYYRTGFHVCMEAQAGLHGVATFMFYIGHYDLGGNDLEDLNIYQKYKSTSHDLFHLSALPVPALHLRAPPRMGHPGVAMATADVPILGLPRGV
ncbi:hypothetical protein Bbelb_244100 [Branchiostoma belcheri]|nr:hypothetical protein Bbelb_244100 [Branchiostoma belcheri]